MKIECAAQIEHLIAQYFDPRRNIIVPNVWWGMGFKHECDLLVLTKTGFAYEVEIKISRSDLKADLKKRTGHHSTKIRKLYFAIPERLKPCIDLIPERAGILVVHEHGTMPGAVRKFREAKSVETARRFTTEERIKLAELGTMRIWPLKRTINDLWEREQSETNRSSWRLEFMG